MNHKDMNDYKYSAFEGYGIEIEYMIVDAVTLDVRAIADHLLEGADDMDVPRGDAAWSNELALHVIEAKTAGPIADLSRGAQIFRREVNAINDLLAKERAILMPTGMHPWMNPFTESQLWPHQNNEIYNAFDRIFGCQGHGWSNLQSMHINFPFKNEEEFSKLHAACRFVLTLLPSISASTPYKDGQRAPHVDQRLAEYRTNCVKVPSITGSVVPEPVYTYADYHELLETLYRDISPFDPGQILQEEWLNARGAIARFDRGAIEIRVIDTQECPEQDLAIAFFTTELVKAIYHEEFGSLSDIKVYSTDALARQYGYAVELGQKAPLDPKYAAEFHSRTSNAQALFNELVSRLVPTTSPHRAALDVIAQYGTLAERLILAHGATEPTRSSLMDLYRQVCACLQNGRPFLLAAEHV